MAGGLGSGCVTWLAPALADRSRWRAAARLGTVPVRETLSHRPAAHRHPHRLVRRPLAGLSLGVISVLLVAPELFGLAGVLPLAEVVAFRPVTCVGLLVLAGLAVVVRRRWWPAALVVAVVAGVALGTVLPRAIAGPTPPAGGTLTLLSFNVYDGGADVTALAGAIRSDQPDLVVLTEAGERFRLRLVPFLTGLPYRSWSTVSTGQPDVNGIVVLASARLGQVTATPLDLGTEFPWMHLTGGQLGHINVVAVHTAAPVAGRMASWIKELGLLRQWCIERASPQIVIGDVNATLDHAPLRDAIVGGTDAAADRGGGLVATWPTSWPRSFGVQIDHVFTTGDLHPAGLRVVDLPGSDHRALLTQIVLPLADAPKVVQAPIEGRAH
jgi:endonuclease/exonuclease/phosphatase (EEP) superfamily protein YafD